MKINFIKTFTMINFKTVNGKRMSMVVWGNEDDGSDKVIVYAGIADWDGVHLTIHWNSSSESYVLPDDWLPRIKPVQPELKAIFKDAEYALSVSISTSAGNIDFSDLNKVGIKWPNEPKK